MLKSLAQQLFRKPEAAKFLAKNEKSTMFLGEMKSGQELWLSDEDLKRHLLIVGASGSGKTTMLLNMLAGALNAGKGYIFVDGKGDREFPDKARTIAAAYGRQDDFLHLNFSDINKRQDEKNSFKDDGHIHTFNLFSSMPADDITQVIISTMEDASGDGAMWKGRTTAMLVGLVRAMVWLRDNGIIDLTPSEIRDHLPLRKYMELTDPALYPTMPLSIRRPLKAYLSSLPGFQEEKGPKQSQTTIDQHGYLIMQLTRPLSLLSDNYGHIFDAITPDIDLRDVILNKRILVVSLPGMEKHVSDLQFLGRFIVSGIRSAIFDTSTERVSPDGTVENRVSARQPVLCVMDEVSNYMVDGLELLVSQSRSMGISMIFSTQTIESMFSASPRSANAILGNTKTKIFLKAEVTSNDITMAYVSGETDQYEEKPANIVSYIRGFEPGEFLISQGSALAIAKAPEIIIKNITSQDELDILFDCRDIANTIAKRISQHKEFKEKLYEAAQNAVQIHEETSINQKEVSRCELPAETSIDLDVSELQALVDQIQIPVLTNLPPALSELQSISDLDIAAQAMTDMVLDKVIAARMMNAAALTAIWRMHHQKTTNTVFPFYGVHHD